MATLLAVFGARGLLDQAGSALNTLLIDDAITFEPIDGSNQIIPLDVLIKLARARPARLIVAVEAQQ